VILRACPHGSVEPCPYSLDVFLQTTKYTFENVNGQVKLSIGKKQFPIPVQIVGMKVTASGLDIRIHLESVPLTIVWDTKKFVQVEATPSIWNRTAGLCGTLDGNPDNDFTSKDGIIQKLPSTFVDSWRMPAFDKPNQNCELQKADLLSSECEPSIEEKANMVCTDLIKNKKLEACIGMFDEDSLIDNCISDYCYCKNTYERTACVCSGISMITKDCAFRGVKLPTDWRDFQICPITCSNGRIYKPCGPVNEPSCGSAIETSTLDCKEGCYCPDGLIYNDGACIKQELCPCKLRGRVFQPKAKIMKDCNTCTCEAGNWKCTDKTCGARCSAIGDPHYQTFDGKHYDFMGKCSYYLLKTKELTIEAENVECSGAISESMNFARSVLNELPSCTKSVTIKFKDHDNDIIIKLKQGGLVVINNQEVTLPRMYLNGALKIRNPSSNFVLVDFVDDIKVWWDGMTRVYIDAPASMRGQTQGLCGTFNSNIKDDFLTPEGDVESVAEPFADKWKTEESCPFMSDRPVPHPCTTNLENKPQAEEICSKLKSEIFEGDFFQ
jgi:von Willebrand factor